MNKIVVEKRKIVAIHANKLPAEIVGRFLPNLSVGDRLKNERVSPRWKRALSKWGWTEQQKLDRDIVFEGVNAEQIARFWQNSDEDNCHLALLLHQCAPWLRELDLHSFGGQNIERLLPQIVETLQSPKKLENLDIRGLRLQDFVYHLPQTLLELKTSYGINIETLRGLSNRCPELEKVPFQKLENKYNLKTEAVIKLAGKFLRQKKLDLFDFSLPTRKQGALASFGQLKALEELNIWNCVSLDGHSLEAIVQGCQHLRSLSCDTRLLTEGELFQLAKLSNLTVLEVDYRYGEGFSDAVLRTIAVRGQLKKLRVFGSKSDNASFTDASIVYLVGQCKSLVSLAVIWCQQISDRSLEAVVAEVRRRHGKASWTFPSGNHDPGIFYLRSIDTGIEVEKAKELINGNPWMRFNVYDPREII